MLIDYDKVNLSLVPEFIRLARRSSTAGYAVGSTAEQIVGALINGRSDWLPTPYTHPLKAIERLHAGGSDWWHTMLYVASSDWEADAIAE